MHKRNELSQTDQPNIEQNNDEKVVAMEENILRILETLKKADFDKRPPIPKIKRNKHDKSALATANRALDKCQE